MLNKFRKITYEGGGYDRDRVVEAGGGLTCDFSLTSTSESSVLPTFSGDILPEECIAGGRLTVATSYDSSSAFDKRLPRID